MRDLVTGEVFPIGTPGQGRMEPIPEALDSHAAAILRKIPDGSDVMIDEVGYLESSCARYAKELERLFDRCTVIAALRKDHTDIPGQNAGHEQAPSSPPCERITPRCWTGCAAARMSLSGTWICTSTPVRWDVW